MGKAKWIGGFLGFIAGGGVLGALAGYALGSVIDSMFSGDYAVHEDNEKRGATGTTGADYQNQRNGFLFSLMVLSAHIIQADGKIMHSEMEHVRRFLRANFGESAVAQGDQILRKLFEYRKQNGNVVWRSQIQQACSEISMAMPQASRLQLVSFLAELVKADGTVHTAEVAALKEIAISLRVDASFVDQMFSVGGSTIDEAYKVLGVSANATDDEVRKAYKKLVVENHPDKVAHLGDDIKEAATRKLQKINEAKDKIYKARNMN